MLNILRDDHIDIYAITRKGRQVISTDKELIERFRRRYYQGKLGHVVTCYTIEGGIDYRLVVGRFEGYANLRNK